MNNVVRRHNQMKPQISRNMLIFMCIVIPFVHVPQEAVKQRKIKEREIQNLLPKFKTKTESEKRKKKT